MSTLTQASSRDSIVKPQRVLFLNQVRGGECCEPGSVANLEKQRQFFAQHDLQASFLFRYDVLIDNKYQSKIRQLISDGHEVGIFLEITPQLVNDSGGEYHGDVSNWYQAQYAYPVGYPLALRQQMVDQLVAAFVRAVGEKPKISGGWLVDTPTINYLHDKYGVVSHEITREQWGTDSYTLTGGPIHYPYYTSRNWAFVPEHFNPDQSVLILRQTISDPLRNYGDMTSAFTSQPNDYARGDRGLDYFRQLLDQALSQPYMPYAVAVLGLENSMPDQWQIEYGKQIEVVGEMIKNHPQLQVITASQLAQELASHDDWHTKMQVVWGKNIADPNSTDSNFATAQTLWITTLKYRIRLLLTDRQIQLTDLRLYDSEKLLDPYTTQVAQNLAYWVTPFLIDGSRYYQEKSPSMPWSEQVKEKLRNWWLPERRYRSLHAQPSQSDLLTQPQAIVFSQFDDDSLTISQPGTDQLLLSAKVKGKPFSLLFTNEDWTLTSNQPQRDFSLTRAVHPSLPIINNDQLMWPTGDNSQPALWLQVQCQTDQCRMTPSFATDFDWSNFQDNYYPFVYPELIPRQLSQEKTLIYAHNPIAVAGKNPVRLVIIPRDELGYLTSTDLQPTFTSQPAIGEFIVNKQQGTDGTIFVDAVDNRIGKYRVTAKLGEITKTETIFFAPNCKEKKAYCLRHPIQSWWYLKAMAMTKLRGI